MKKKVILVGIVIILLLGILELIAGIRDYDFLRILAGVFTFVIGCSYFYEIKKD